MHLFVRWSIRYMYNYVVFFASGICDVMCQTRWQCNCILFLQSLFINTEGLYQDTSSSSPDERQINANDPLSANNTNTSSHDPAPAASESVCIICHMNAVDRVILPCRHATVCETCFTKVDCCPMCRGAIESTFLLHEVPRNPTTEPVTEQYEPQSLWTRINNRINNFFGID